MTIWPSILRLLAAIHRALASQPVTLLDALQVVDPDALAAFEADYVSLMSLVQDTGVHFKRVKRDLQEVDVEPDWRFGNVPTTVIGRVRLTR